MKVYIDGCSYTYGLRLAREYSLANLLSTKTDWEIIDRSRPGKSNYSMCLDLYFDQSDADLYIINWTYGYRLELKINENIVDLIPNRTGTDVFDIETLAKEYDQTRDKFFSYVNRFDEMNDFFVDASIISLRSKDKKFIISSWEPRQSKETVLYLQPLFDETLRQQDCEDWQKVGHLNEKGMQKLASVMLKRINNE